MAISPYLAASAQGDQYVLRFRFQINGTTHPNFQFPAGAVKDITRASAGVFAIQLLDNVRPPAMTGLVGSVMSASGAGLGLVPQAAVADYVVATGVLTVRLVDTYTDATPAAADPEDDAWVYLDVCFQTRTTTASVGAV